MKIVYFKEIKKNKLISKLKTFQIRIKSGRGNNNSILIALPNSNIPAYSVDK